MLLKKNSFKIWSYESEYSSFIRVSAALLQDLHNHRGVFKGLKSGRRVVNASDVKLFDNYVPVARLRNSFQKLEIDAQTVKWVRSQLMSGTHVVL